MNLTQSQPDLRLLAIETTCDEPAAAVISGDRRILASVIASQNELHAAFQGVVPEIAARAHVESILPVIDQALQRLQSFADTKGLVGQSIGRLFLFAPAAGSPGSG